MKVRINHPEHGWGEVQYAVGNMLAGLYPDAGFPEFLLFVRWDDGNGGWADPDREGVIFENVSGLREMVERAARERR
jgi:hypothetical protein